jgi:spermidine/putrescine ABC transporter ATP-binding subunit
MSKSFALELKAVVRNYGKGAVVGPIDIQVNKGEFVSLLGPSGCGKTTMLRCIAGFESVDEGCVLVDGVDITRQPPHKRNIGLVFQSYALFPHLTVRENIRFGLKMQRKVPKAEAEAKIADVLRMVGLDHLAERYPAQLSGGQQQRVAIARSVVLNPPLLLLDEPLSNLDFKLRVQMREELRSLQRRLGTTFIYVTHDQTEALAMSDRVVVLSQGKIAQVGAPRDIYQHPATRFVADFIGASNLLRAMKVDPLGAGAARVTLDNGRHIRCAGDMHHASGDQWVSVRPENVRVADMRNAHSHSENVFKVDVLTSTFCGDKYEVWVQFAGEDQGDAASTRLMMHLPPDRPPEEQLWVFIEPELAELVGAGA